jgi:hypothetical protein
MVADRAAQLAWESVRLIRDSARYPHFPNGGDATVGVFVSAGFGRVPLAGSKMRVSATFPSGSSRTHFVGSWVGLYFAAASSTGEIVVVVGLGVATTAWRAFVLVAVVAGRATGFELLHPAKAPRATRAATAGKRVMGTMTARGHPWFLRHRVSEDVTVSTLGG